MNWLKSFQSLIIGKGYLRHKHVFSYGNSVSELTVYEQRAESFVLGSLARHYCAASAVCSKDTILATSEVD